MIQINTLYCLCTLEQDKTTMIVSISEAARMVGIKSRSTMYRHIKKKNITVTEDEGGNPGIDVSELVRVYGSKVKTSDKTENKTPKLNQVVQDKTHHDSTKLEVLKERIKHFEFMHSNQEEERRKERGLLIDQIENLRKTVEEAQGQNKRLTALITDQSGQQQKKEEDRDSKIQSLEKMILELKIQNDDLLAKEKMRIKRIEERRAQREKEKQSEIERQIAEENKSFLQKLFW